MSLMVMVELLASSRMLSSTKPKPAPCTTDNSSSSSACISARAKALSPSKAKPANRSKVFISAPGGRGAQAGVLPRDTVERLVEVDIDRRNHIAVGVFVLGHIHERAFEGGHKGAAVHIPPGHILGLQR